MRRNQKKHAFTLVELIVVITILAILWTIAFISLQWYSAQARDSKRLSDISNIKKSVELFSLSTWKFPKPDDSFTVSYSWEILWYQWTVWDQVSTNVSRNLNEKPLDPSTGIEYTYSTTHSQTEYEVLGLYESDLVSTSPLFFAKATKSRQPSPLGREGARPNVGANLVFAQQLSASTQDYPKIDWNYNWIYIKTSSFYVPTPSIINAEIVSNYELDNDLIKSQIVTGWDNLPWISTWWLDVTFSKYEWTITSDSTDEQKSALVQAIKTAYSWSELASDTMYADILSRTGTWELLDFVDVVVLGRTEYSNTSSNTSNTTNTENYNFTFLDIWDWIQENDWLWIILDEEKLVLSGDYQSTPSNMVNPATVILLGWNSHKDQTWAGLIDESQVNERASDNVFYWNTVYVDTSYVSYNIAENFRIWRSWTVTWDHDIGKVKIEKMEGESWVEIIDKHLSMTQITHTTWAKFTDELEAWSYRFYLYDSSLSRIDSEWFFEKAGSGYVTSQPYYITTSDINQLDLSNISTINSVDIINTQPTWTSIKALVSFDWRSTWKKWNGLAWVYVWELGYTNDLCELWIASASHVYLWREASRAFDNLNSGYLNGNIWTGNSGWPYWLKYDFWDGNNKKVTKYTLTTEDGIYYSSRAPYSWYFQWSNDESNWITLDTKENIINWERNIAKEFVFSNTNYYRYYRWYFTSWAYSSLMIGEAEMKDEYRTGGLEYIQVGNTIAEIEEWLTNLNITSEVSLDFAFDLATTDELVTPEISGISVSYEE